MGVVNEPWYLKNLFFSRGSKSIGLMGLIFVLVPSVFTFFRAAKQMKNMFYVIWTGPRMSKLVLNVKYLLLLSFLTVAEFYNLGHIQGNFIRIH